MSRAPVHAVDALPGTLSSTTHGRGVWAWLAVLLSGVLLGLSQPVVIDGVADSKPIDPTGLTGLLAFIGYVPVLVAMRDATPRRAYLLGMLTTTLSLTIIYYWLLIAMHVFGGVPVLGAIAALLLLNSFLGAFVGSAFPVTRVIDGRFKLPQWIVFPMALTTAELLRNYVPFGGYPWGNVGTSLATVPVLLQCASLFGVYGFVFVIGLVNGALAEVVAWWLRRRAHAELRFPKPAVAVAAGVMVALTIFGAVRLSTPIPEAPTVRVGLLQGNIDQGIKNNSRENWDQILPRFRRLQNDALAQGAQLIVWPEASYPIPLPADLKSLRDIGKLSKSIDISIVPSDATPEQTPGAAIIGVVARGKYDAVTKTQVRHNAAFMVGKDLEIIGRVDKTHLVPFGEYVPWPLQEIVKQIVPMSGETPGTGFEPYDMVIGGRTVRVGTTICYEGIFPEITRTFARKGAELMINITNDAWYGVSSAATQHLLMYSLRAVESGRPVARAANTGLTAWVDIRGKIHALSELYTERAVVVDVPLANEGTLFNVLGEWVSVPCFLTVIPLWILSLLGPGFLKRKRRRVDAAIGVVGIGVALVAVVVYSAMPSLAVDESNATRALFATLSGLLIGTGALSGRPWGRRAQRIFGVLFILAGVIACIQKAVPAGAALVVLGVFLLAVHRKSAAWYARPVDPLVPVDEGREKASA
jgi:apolipoprotein N-acyltransferase